MIRPPARLAVFLLPLLLPLLLAQSLSGQARAQLYGRVTTLGADGEPIYLVGARLVLTPQSDPSQSFDTLSDNTGAYSFTDLAAGSYTIEVSLQGYETATQQVELKAGVLQELNLVLSLARVQEQIEVRGEVEGIQPQQTTPTEQLKADVYENAPLASERFLEALPLVPGVVRGSDGLLKVKGAPSSQTGWLVNSSNVSDPVTGEQAINLPVDVIEEVEVLPNPYNAEYGKFTGAVTTIETKPSTNKWKFKLNNFVPRLRRRNDSIRGVESATPRLTLSGPLVKDRLTFLQSFEYRLTRAPITSLPELEQDSDIESFDSFTQFDATLSPLHRLTTVFSSYPQKNRFATLDTFNTQPTTANYRQRGWMAGARDHFIFGDGSLLQTTFSVKDFDTDVFPATPDLTFLLRPERRLGGFFNKQQRVTRRYELLEIYNFAPQQAHGQHMVKLGFGVTRNNFRGFHRSTAVEVRRNDNTLAERIDFVGSTTIGLDDTEYTAFLHDKWNLTRRLTFDLGLRYDYDTLAEENNFAPRLAFAYVLTADARTLVRGGVGLFYDKVPLNVGSFEQLQQRVVTRFAADGLTVVDGPRTFLNRSRDIENPRSLAFNLELDREFAPGLVIRLSYLQRETRNEYIVEPFEQLEGAPTLLLDPSGRSRYYEYGITANYHFREGSFLNLSYLRSKSSGDLNSFARFYGNFENPIIRPNERSRLGHDVPDRFLAWGEVELLWGVRWAPVLDVRSGFPHSLLDEEQQFIGARNQGGRFPVFASFDSQVFKDFRVKVYGKVRKLRVGLKVFNILDHFNPRDLQENAAAPDALGLFNSRGRLFRGKLSIDF